MFFADFVVKTETYFEKISLQLPENPQKQQIRVCKVSTRDLHHYQHSISTNFVEGFLLECRS